MISAVVTTWGKDEWRDCLESLRASDCVGEIIEVENGNGAGAARNEGRKQATEEYIIYVDADTVLEPGALDLMKGVLDLDGAADFVYCNYRRAGEMSPNWTDPVFRSRPWDLQALIRANYIDTTSLIRRVKDPEWDDELERLLDWDHWLTIGLAGGRGHWMDEVLFTKRFTAGDISLRGCDDYVKWHKKVIEKHMRRLAGDKDRCRMFG